MTTPPDFAHLSLDSFSYPLPEDKIAQTPLSIRDNSKLLVYQSGKIQHHTFKDIAHCLTSEVCLVMNDTKVVQARFFFQKKTGAYIQIFCLEPLFPHQELSLALAAHSPVEWSCMVGHLKRWKEETLSITDEEHVLCADILSRETTCRIRFTWNTDETFGEILQRFGKLPLPPYINRLAVAEDLERYQTVYSSHLGAVAAPTAGLHFTSHVLSQLAHNKIDTTQITLHVGAGTFKPVTTHDIAHHKMHTEEIHISTDVLQKLSHNIIPVAVGTTSLRTLESLYWIAAQIRDKKENPLFLAQWDCYDLQPFKHLSEAWTTLQNFLQQQKQEKLTAYTQLMIVPGYTFQVCKGLITNFHQPQSTLLMLIAAFIGDDWKKIYDEALMQNYRFLSYGDSSLLWR